MSEQVIYGTLIKEIAGAERLAQAEKRQTGGKPVFYLLPSSALLQGARKKVSTINIATFDDLATYVLTQEKDSMIFFS